MVLRIVRYRSAMLQPDTTAQARSYVRQAMTLTLDISGNPLVCDCDLRWYRQWIQEEWNEIEQEWLSVTDCKDPADGDKHNIAEVPLKDMFCTQPVSDLPGRVV